MTEKKTTAKKAPAKKAPAKKTAAKKVSGSAKAAPAKATTKDVAVDGPLGQAIAAVRTPVYAYVGVNDLAIQAVTGLVTDLRRRAEDAVTDAQTKVTERYTEAQTKVTREVTQRLERRIAALEAEMQAGHKRLKTLEGATHETDD